MPSVFTIEGVSAPRKAKKARKPRRPKNLVAPPSIGTCQTVTKSNGCKIDLCYVGKAKARSGWAFKAGTSRCPVRR